jgi:hypothetical protein
MRTLSDGSGMAVGFCIDDLLSRFPGDIAIEAISEQDEGLGYSDRKISGQ